MDDRSRLSPTQAVPAVARSSAGVGLAGDVADRDWIRVQIAEVVGEHVGSGSCQDEVVDVLVDIVVRHTGPREAEGVRTVLTGGWERLAGELVVALDGAHDRLLPHARGDHDLAHEAGHGRVSILLSQAVAAPAIAGWCFGRARQASLLPSVQSAVRELAIAAGALDIDPVGTRRPGMVVDAVHAAIDELDSLYTGAGDGR